MSRQTDPLTAARARVRAPARRVASAGDLPAALAALAELEHAACAARERLAVTAVLDKGWSYAHLAAALRITRQGAHKTYAPAVAEEMRRRRRRITDEITIRRVA